MSDNKENELENADEVEKNEDLDNIWDEDNKNEDEDKSDDDVEGEEEDDDDEDVLDSDEAPSATPSNKASNDAKQKDSPDNSVAEDVIENDENENDDDVDEDEDEGEDEDVLDFDETPSMTPSDKASNDAKQKDSPDNSVVKDVIENDENENDDDVDEDEDEDEDEDFLDFDETPSMTPSDKASNDAKQKDSPGNSVAEDVTKEEPKGQSADPMIPSPQAKVKRIGKEAVDSLMLDLTFETVRKTITLAELKSIKPGYTFISQNPVNSPIEIRANGKLIGYGKLVSVDGSIGVQITEFI
jgi:flagellar motor switch/type III secretory pathway protein FliN